MALSKMGVVLNGLVATAMGQTKEDLENLEPFSALLLGSSQNMTDTIMVFKYNPQTQNAYLLSIPRDTFIGDNKNSAKAADKINSVYQGKYPEKTLAAVNKVTGLNLKYYILVDTTALRALVDVIGGVYFDVPIDMKYTDKNQGLYINLKSGYQLLDGNKAEQVVRFRHNQDGSSYPIEYGDNDTGRMKTQRNFLKAVIKQTLTPDNILNIGKFIDIAQTYVKTNIPINILKQYIAPAVNFSVDNLETETLPGVNQKCNGVWIFLANKTKTKTFLTKMNNKLAGIEEITKEDLQNINIEILNGNNNSSKLTKAKQTLTNAGFNIINTSKTNPTEKTIIINKSNIKENILTSIQILLETGNISNLNPPPEINQSNPEPTNNITIILGNDYE